MPAEEVERFVDRLGWERFPYEMDGRSCQVFLARLDETLDPRKIRIRRLSQEGRRAARLTPGNAVLVMIDDTRVTDEDLAAIEDLNNELLNLPKRRPGDPVPKKPEKRKHETFTNNQLEVVKEIWRKPQRIAEVLDVSDSAVSSRSYWAKRAAGVRTTHELFFWAVDDDIINPWAVEVDAEWDPEISGRNLEMIKDLRLTPSELQKKHGGGATSRLSRLLTRTGADTRYELWILAVQAEVIEFP